MNLRPRQLLPAGLLAGLLALAAGCAGGTTEEKYPASVKGTVTLDGERLEMGMVTFTSEDGNTSSMATILDDGTFEQGGVPAGKVKVGVKTSHLEAQAKALGRDKARARKGEVKGGPGLSLPPGLFRAVPRKYEDPTTSNLVYDLKAGDNTLEIKLDGKAR
jgi:hypothetical protein